jgi:hypothetical protein
MRESQRADQANTAGRVQEARRGDRSGAERERRKGEADEVEAQERLLRAIAFIRRRFSDERLGDDVSAYEAVEVIKVTVSLLFGIPVENSNLEPCDEVLIHQGEEFLTELKDFTGYVRQQCFVH